MKFINIKNQNMIRDMNNMAIINTDHNELEQYKLKRQLFNSQKKEINNINDEINNIKQDISEIKTLLMEILKNAN